MYKKVYFGLDAHNHSCVLAIMDQDGVLISNEGFGTSEARLIYAVSSIRSHQKFLAVEESSLPGIATTLRPYVTELIVCDPRQNALISRSGHKDDFADAFNLCRLLRLEELSPVYHADESHRVDFKIAVQQYLSFREEHAKLKRPIKAKFQQAGIVRTTGIKIFSKMGRDHYLNRLPTDARREIILNLYECLDAAGKMRKKARESMIKLGKRYPEIQQFMRVPGVGIVGAHVFSAFIQTPHRFATKQRLWKYCKLSILERSSAGKPLAYKRLDPSGSGILNSISHQCCLSALRTKDPNEVSLFYEASLQRTGDKTHARLNTQRKVLAVLWTIWKNNVDYNPKRFYSPPKSAVTSQSVTNS